MPTVLLPGQGEELAQALAGIGSGIAHLVNPHLELREKVNTLIASNPEYAQKLGDLERNNPGYLKKLGLSDKVASAVSGIAETPEQMVQRVTSNAIKTTTPDQLSSIAQEGIAHAKGFKNAEDMLASETRAAHIPSVSPTVAQAGAEKAVAGQDETSILADRAINQRNEQIATQGRTLLSDLMTKNPVQARQIIMDENYAKYLEHHTTHEKIAGEIAVAEIKDRGEMTDWYKKFKLTSARTFLDDINYASGNIATAQDYLYDDTARARARDLFNGATPKDQRDIDLLNLYKGQKQLAGGKLLGRLAEIKVGISGALNNFANAKNEFGQEAAKVAFNLASQEATAMGYPKFTAVLEEKYPGLPKMPGKDPEMVLRVKDAKGNEVPPEDMMSTFDKIPDNYVDKPPVASKNPAVDTGLSSTAQHALDTLNDPTIDKAASIEALRKSDAKTYAELKRLGKI